jgi:hypothetical protein
MIARNPKWANREHTMIELEVDWEDHPYLKGFHPFIAAQEDPHDHGRELFDHVVAGAFGRIAEWGV